MTLHNEKERETEILSIIQAQAVVQLIGWKKFSGI